MKASYKPPKPAEPTVILEMTKYEAQVLRYIAAFDCSIPDLLFKHEDIGRKLTREELSHVLTTITNSLHDLFEKE